MNKKSVIVLTIALAAVVGLYFYLYRDSFRKASIQISHTIRPRPAALMRRLPDAPQDDAINMITFRLDHPYQLTALRVVSVAELETNKYAVPIWELKSDSNSVPVPAFAYGSRIRGMHPVIKNQRPGELMTNVTYRLFLEAGSITGEHDFSISEENRLAH